ncbi:D-isomer specific 2-hydroxyacid dehydrogenase family protein [Kiloniella sp. EL199]|uniref:NAD(P)-dependent oxidoreductase n=1 Tax=Kiloniella sp. EL199 TaxID=2107581 RepID=UPI0013C4C225|nr:NAD(P)-dependent oxidoreductase [Kiloniella sp. EL199]
MTPTIAILEKIHPVGLKRLQQFSNVIDLTEIATEKALIESSNADALVVKSVTPINRETIKSIPNLKIVARAGTGMENINTQDLEELGIEYFNVPTGNSVSAAEFTIGLIFAICKKFPETLTAISKGDFRRHLLEGRELSKMTVGVIGLGNVGSRVANRLIPFGCKVIGWDKDTAKGKELNAAGGQFSEDINEIYSQSDVISLHLSLTEDTRHFLNTEAFTHIKKGTILINTARAACIDTQAMLCALDNGTLSSAAVDVLDPEPPFTQSSGLSNYTHPLLEHPKVIVTPHLAASTRDAQQVISETVGETLYRFFS